VSDTQSLSENRLRMCGMQEMEAAIFSTINIRRPGFAHRYFFLVLGKDFVASKATKSYGVVAQLVEQLIRNQ
jgi:hypothetical protein